MAYRALQMQMQFEDANGNPAVGHTLEFFVYNTTTPAALYTNTSGTALGTSCSLNSQGVPQTTGGTEVPTLFGNTAQTTGYKVVQKDADGAPVRTFTGPIFPTPGALSDLGGAADAGSITYRGGTLEEYLDDRHFANALDYGPATAATVQAALLANDAVDLGDAEYTFEETVNVQPNQVIRGRGKAVINIAGNFPGFLVDGRPSEGYQHDMRVRISGLHFVGTGAGASFNAGDSAQYAIYLSYAYNCHIDNCEGYELGGALIATANTRNEGTGVVYVEGNTITNCRSYDCNAGFLALSRGEYTNVSGCAFVTGHVGAWIRGGNNTISACNLSLNGTAVHLADGDNDAHGIVNCCQLNHSEDYGIYVADGVINGHQFIACELYSDAVYIGAAQFITIENCQLNVATWTFASSIKCWVRNNTFHRARADITYNISADSEVLWPNNIFSIDNDMGAIVDKYQGGYLRASRITSSQTVAAGSNAVLIFNNIVTNAVANNTSYNVATFLDVTSGHITMRNLHSGPVLISGVIKAEITTDYTSLLLSLEVNGAHHCYIPSVDQLAIGPSTYRRIFCLNTFLILNEGAVFRFRLINTSGSNAANFLVSESMLEINGL